MIRRLLLVIALLLWSHAALALGVHFTSPTQTTYIHSASFTVEAHATAFQDGEAVTSLKLYRWDGALLASGTTSASASISSLGVGTYNFKATGTNNWGQSVSKSLTITVNPSKVIGNIDGVPADSSGPYITGWACSTGLTQSIDVHVYAGGPAGTGTYVRADRADKASEAAVASACQSTGTAYRFSIPLSQSIRDTHGGKTIHIHGISPVGQPNDLISNSGVFIIPVSRNAGFVAQSVPTTMVVGRSYAVSVQMRNDGSTVWRPSEAYRLGSQNPHDNSTWGTHRVELPGEVAKGGTATINFTAKAPTAAGTYNFQWRMLQEGVEWFGATTPNVAVRVVSGSISGSPNPCTIQYGASTCTATISWSSTASDAEVWVTDANNANAQLFARAQSGSLNATNITTATSRFHLKAAGQTMATVDVAGTPAANVAPAVHLTAPLAGNNGIAPASVAFVATATDTDDGVASVSFYRDNGVLLGSDTTAPYTFTWPNVAAGNYNVYAVARDTRNATTTSATVSITIVAPVVNPSSSTRYYFYDQHQQLCKVVEPETRATVMQYDAAGNVAWSAAGLELMSLTRTQAQCDSDRANAEASGRVVRRSYDVRNRLHTLRFPDGRGNQDWAYTADGQPQTITTHNSSGTNPHTVVNTYSYNRRGLLARETSGQPGWYDWPVGYRYDANGNLASQSYPTGATVSYAPNALGQPTQAVAGFGVLATGVQYYPNGAIRQFTYGNGIVHTMTQNARQLPLRVTSNGVLDYEYGFDKNGNVGHIYDHARGSSFSRWMHYDGLDRLTAAGSASFGGDHWHRFTYDRLDNITSWKLAGVKDLAEYYYEPGTHRLISIRNSMGSTTVGMGYDPQGNLQNKNGEAHAFDHGNRLRTVHTAGGQYNEGYRYDGHGRRVLAWKPNAGNILSMYGQNGQMLYEHDERTKKAAEHIYLAGSLIAKRSRDWANGNTMTVTYQHTDALGSPVAVTDAAGTVIERTDYEPYGAIVGGVRKQGVGYTGHVMDAATGLTYMQQRYYDPGVGRFLSVDPVTALDNGDMRHFNRYAYAYNNPYAFTDPDGRLPILIPVAGAAARCAANAACRTAVTTGVKKAAELAGRYWRGAAGGAATAGAAEGIRQANESADTSQGGEQTPSSPEINPADVAGKTPGEIDGIARGAGLVPKGSDPSAGKGSYVDPVTGKQRILVHPDADCGPHCHVNDKDGNRLDIDGNQVAPETPEAHLPLGRKQ